MIVALKTIGYVISILSVILLGTAAWQTTKGNDFLQMCLIGGMIASVLGMLLRWISHLQDQREKNKLAQNS
jgi:NADH:ubiquinone oxidoreductase subunit 6 (subunit J)